MPNLLNDIAVSERLDSVINGSMGQIKREQKTKRIKRTAAGTLGVIFMLGIGFIFCVNNTVFASRLPLIGNIFSRMQGKTSYLGDLSENAQQLVKEEETDSALQDENVENPYVQTSNGVTVTISEINCDQKDLYMAVSIESEEPFYEGIMHKKNIKGNCLEYDTLYVEATGDMEPDKEEQYSGGSTPDRIEGEFVDDHTFVGVMSVSMYRRMWPAKFRYELSISRIYSEDCFDETTEKGVLPDGEEVDIPVPRELGYEGAWSFRFDVEVDSTKYEILDINEQNENGFGIAAVWKTSNVIWADVIAPEDESSYDYMVVMCDANGDRLDSTGGNLDQYSPYGRDLSTVYLFVCSDIEYLDELKGYGNMPGYETRKKEKTYAEYMKEHALFSTEVHFK